MRSATAPRRNLALLGAVVLFGVVGMLGAAPPAEAHPLSTSAVFLDIDQPRVSATIDLPLDELSVARDQALTSASVMAPAELQSLRSYTAAHLSATDNAGRRWKTVVSGGKIEKVDGVDNLVLDATLTPEGGTVGDFVLHDDVIMDTLISHRIFVSARFGDSGTYTSLAMLSWQTPSVTVASTTPAPRIQSFSEAIRLGVHHISSGSDHLLFLIMLLLPAPLIAAGRRWSSRPDTGWRDLGRSGLRVFHMVTAFALGHSCTLLLGALGWVHLPTRLVESGIALSVLVSAIHAIKPLVRRGEVLIAGGFGLLHGLAFAALLQTLNLSRGGLITTLLGFNLGIEFAQFLVVLLVMPSLLMISCTRLYRPLRIALAMAGAVLATGWLAERMGMINTNPTEPVADALVQHPLIVVFTLAGTGLLAWLLGSSSRGSLLLGEAKVSRGPS